MVMSDSTQHVAEELVLHFGQAKTGSTAIQRALCNAKEILLDKYQTLYPGPFEQHYHLQSVFSSQPEELIQIKRLGISDHDVKTFLDTYKASMIDEINAQKPRRIIISSEYLAGMNYDELRRLRKFLDSITDRIILFGYVRDPWGFALSHALEKIRNGIVVNLKEIDYEDCDLVFIRNLEAGLGAKAEIRPYISGLTDVVEDFFSRFSISETLLKNGREDSKVNKTITCGAGLVLNLVNTIFPTFDAKGSLLRDDARDWVIDSIVYGFSDLEASLSKDDITRIGKESAGNIKVLESEYLGGRRVYSEHLKELSSKAPRGKISLKLFTKDQLMRGFAKALYFLASRCISHINGLKAMNRDRDEEIEALRSKVDAQRIVLEHVSLQIKEAKSWMPGVEGDTFTDKRICR